MRDRRLLRPPLESHYVGLGHEFWGCFRCRTHNSSGDKTCWICKKPRAEASKLPDTLICREK